jgi:hypothetical protein
MGENMKKTTATAAAKKQGFKPFKEGSAGDKEQDKVAEGIARQHRVVKGPAKKGK